MATLLAPPRTSFTPPRGVPDFPCREAEREAGTFAEKMNEFIATAPRNVPLTDDDIMEEIRQVRREVREKVAAAEQSLKAGRVMDGFDSLKIVRMKHGL